jgi:uncharacterized membrane protein YbaN (DUF454 family)
MPVGYTESKRTRGRTMSTATHALLSLIIAIVRRIVGLLFLLIGILGLLLPILPGWPFIIPAVVLLGRKDRVLRFSHLVVRWSLRHWRRSQWSWLRRLARFLTQKYVETRRVVVPAIDATERMFARFLTLPPPERA